jgi:hypothetical protein
VIRDRFGWKFGMMFPAASLAAGSRHHGVGEEDESRRRLGVAAGACGRVVLAAELEVMAARAARGEEIRERAGVLPVVPVLGVERAEVRRVVVAVRGDAGPAQGAERRRVDRGLRAARVPEPERLPRVLRLHEEVGGEDAVVARHEEVGRRLTVDQRHRVDAQRSVDGGEIGVLVGLLDVVGGQLVVAVDAARELSFVPAVRGPEIVGSVEKAQRVRHAAGLTPVGAKEPESILEHRPAEGGRVYEVRLVGVLRAAAGGDGVLLRPALVDPVRVVDVRAVAALELVAAALGHGVDDAAREAPVFRRDAGGQDRDFFEGILDEQVVRVPEEVVVDVDAVEQEHVVVREGTRDRDLPGVRRVGGQPGRQGGDGGEVSIHRELVHHLFVLEVGGDLRLGQDRRRRADDLDRLLYVRDGHRGVGLRIGPEPNLEFLLDGAEPRQVERHDVAARRKAPEVVAAGVVGDDRPLALKGGRLQRHGHTG